MENEQTPVKLPPAYRLIALDSVDSTNEEAKRRAAAPPDQGGADDGTVIWAREQTVGKGRQARVWESPPGNLYFSIVLRPDAPPAVAAQLSFVTAVALGGAIGAIVPPLVELRYKWPNDLMLDGGKAAGILLESSTGSDGALDWLIVGVGVNVASHPKGEGLNCSSLNAVGASSVTVEETLLGFSRHFLSWTQRWLDEGFGPVRKAWLDHALGLGEEIEVVVGDRTLRGVFKDIDQTGALLLEDAEGGVSVIAAGDVFLIG